MRLELPLDDRDEFRADILGVSLSVASVRELIIAAPPVPSLLAQRPRSHLTNLCQFVFDAGYFAFDSFDFCFHVVLYMSYNGLSSRLQLGSVKFSMKTQ